MIKGFIQEVNKVYEQYHEENKEEPEPEEPEPEPEEQEETSVDESEDEIIDEEFE